MLAGAVLGYSPSAAASDGRAEDGDNVVIRPDAKSRASEGRFWFGCVVPNLTDHLARLRELEFGTICEI
jgi:hypothetical protein